MRVRFAALAAAVTAALAAGCGQPPGPAPDRVAVVASTDVWGSVARAVAGEHATVTALMTGTVADPHSYEASPADAAAVTDATLVVYNGGHYDEWVADVLADHPEVPAIDAYSLKPGRPADNEHVFYDLPTAKAVAAAIADRLAERDPEHAAGYRASAAEFGRGADEVLTTERAIGRNHPSASVVSTEPVAYYLLTNAGITDRTPKGFAGAIEHDTDPAPADLAAMLDLIDGRKVSALLYNPQTETALTRQLRDAALRAGLPVVEVTETLPEGTDYLTWQRQTVTRLQDALDRAPKPGR
ncbi:MAG: zinc ABC transporter substrate-binding protein [Mycolicibacterium hassiacum]|jgi:zinc/manganese transport system substrate-binding protein|uniref:metal ABC transporter solute-binding protein, Zn/Mn family n=1 Tax=Mycolicibacterium hassiacum TaxID=46351 RepID=UPI0023F97C87|nr:zinc ABC transporter substrate-binding protein [Mycolicibacterium hassiacum]MBX5486056.1 zinc ABC transporter substrate-binding protein [Mycolicibacterium hassiacum]